MIKIRVAYALPERQVEIPCEVTNDCTVVRAIKQSGILQQFPDIPFPDIQVGIFGKKVALDHLLEDGDRIEIYRDLTITPMEARRLRAKRAR